jgi:hypothetical protein
MLLPVATTSASVEIPGSGNGCGPICGCTTAKGSAAGSGVGAGGVVTTDAVFGAHATARTKAKNMAFFILGILNNGSVGLVALSANVVKFPPKKNARRI